MDTTALTGFEIILSSTAAALSLTLAYLYYLGYRHSHTGEGAAILLAILFTWATIAVNEIKCVMMEVLSIIQEHPPYDLWHYICKIPTQALILVAAVYFLRATLKRNPPMPLTSEAEAVQEAVDDRK